MCAEQPGGEGKEAPMPICFTRKHLSFAVVSKVCSVTVLLLPVTV